MPPSPKTILGIDPGFGRLGFGFLCFQKGRIAVLDYGVITTPGRSGFSARLNELGADFLCLIKSHHPDLVSIEKLFFAKNTKTAMGVAEARGVILYLCARNGLPVVEFTPAQIKKAVTGNGSADKKAVEWMVKELLALRRTPKLDDASDALAAALTAASVRW
jgi:crossover junction endodeoxyribonuclease RuvC